jgi:antitoxin component YwqK of YwqJK toxin-antitoxin module
MRRVTILSCALLLASAASALEVVRFHHGNGQLREEFTRNERGNKQGAAREFSPEGQLLRESTYEDGREVGLVRAFYPDGKPRRLAFHLDGREQAAIEYTPRGQVAQLRCGPRPLLAPVADDVHLCGFGRVSNVELFDASGKVRTRLRYEEGKATRAENLHANGQVANVEEIVGDRRSEKRFDAEGRLLREQVWAEGFLALDRSFYLNGQPRSSTEWRRNGERVERTVRDFHDNGQLSGQGLWVTARRGRAVPVGAHESFDEAGRKRAETLHDDQGRPTRERAWDAAGQLVRDDAVFEDGSRRAFSR